MPLKRNNFNITKSPNHPQWSYQRKCTLSYLTFKIPKGYRAFLKIVRRSHFYQRLIDTFFQSRLLYFGSQCPAWNCKQPNVPKSDTDFLNLQSRLPVRIALSFISRHFRQHNSFSILIESLDFFRFIIMRSMLVEGISSKSFYEQNLTFSILQQN